MKMQITTLESIVKEAETAAHSNNSWHFHMLSPNCKFNDNPKQHALLVEILNGPTWVTYSDERPMDIGQKLVALLHGNKILTGSGDTNRTTQPEMKTILDRTKDLNAKGILWHHHMLFPQCVLNQHQGKWNLIFEDPETNEILNVLYESEPINDLKEVEALFYAQKK